MRSPLVYVLITAANALENQFELPKIVRQPLYEVNYLEYTPLNLDTHPEHLVNSVYHLGTPMKCLVPELEVESNSPLKPVEKELAIHLARDILGNFASKTTVAHDDTWGWSAVFDRSLVQFIPFLSPEKDSYMFLDDKFWACTGLKGDSIGHNLQQAVPAVIHDKHAMLVVFDNGTYCDISQGPRKTNMFFVCDEKAEFGEPRLQSAWEPHSCIYELVWGVRELCGLSEFSQNHVKANNIVCGPDSGLSEEAYETYRVRLQAVRAQREDDFGLNVKDMEFNGPAPRLSL